jgi:hypothetical protein
MKADLAPPPAIDPAAPMITRTERIVVDRPAADVARYVVEADLATQVLATRRLPGVVGVAPLTPGPWGAPGGRRVVRLSDGTQTTEQMLERTADRFRYQVWDYTTAAARPIAYALGEFRFVALEGGRAEIVWTYAFRLRSDTFPGSLGGLGRWLMKTAFLDTAYAELMRTALAAIKSGAELRT